MKEVRVDVGVGHEDEVPAWVLAELTAGPMTIATEMPDWLLEAPSWDEPPGCECAFCPPPVSAVAAPAAPVLLAAPVEPVRWAIPGVWDDDPVPAPVAVGTQVAALQTAVAALVGQDLLELPGAVALAEAAAMEQVVQQLRVLLLPRLADVDTRKLFTLAGFHGVAGWLRAIAPDADPTDRTLARRLLSLPALEQAVRDGRVSLIAARKVAQGLRTVTPFLDRPDGLIDGQPGEPVIDAVIDNTLDLVGRAFGGLDEPVLTRLSDQVALIHLAGGSQLCRVEQALILLAEHLPTPAVLAGAVQEQTFALVPNLLEQQQAAAEARRGAALRRCPDGSWEFEARLTPECGERIFAALAAEARRDPANPVDTLAREHQREHAHEAGGDSGRDHGHDLTGADLPAWERDALTALGLGPGPDHVAQVSDLQHLGLAAHEAEEAALLVPRTRSRRLHDALDLLLQRYLSAGLGGMHDKVPVQIAVTIPAATVPQQPGALPGTSSTGRPLARSVLQRWWCDAHITTLILNAGWTPIGHAHSARTITGTERKALNVQYGNRCVGADCCPSLPDPLIPLVPHHVIRFTDNGRTQLAETLPVCGRLHHDLHTGKRTITLRDGRRINEHGILTDD